MGITAAQQQALLATLGTLQSQITALPVDTPVVVAGAGPHLPTGLTVESVYDFPDPIPASQADTLLSDSWHVIYNGPGNLTQVVDASAPVPGTVLSVRFPQGFAGGSGPGELWRPLRGGQQVYLAFRVKVQVPWQGHPSNVNKLAYVFTNSAGSIFLCFYGTPGGPYHLRAFPQFTTSADTWLTPNQDPTPFPVDGQYHLVEWYVDHGTVAWALDGTIQGEYSGLPIPSDPFTQMNLDAVWGGAGGVKAETDYLFYDGVYLAGA